MSKKEEIVEYLKDEYQPQAIILHGSRVRGQAGENSDWDFFLLDEEGKGITSERYNGESLDIQQVDPTLLEEEIVEQHGPEFLGAELVYDTDGTGKKFLQRAQSAAAGGPDLSVEEIENRKNYMLRYLHRMKDRQNKQGAFFWYLSVFYAKAVQYWFEILHDEWAEPVYAALDEIEERDPEYFSELEILYENNSVEEKIKASENIFSTLFARY